MLEPVDRHPPSHDGLLNTALAALNSSALVGPQPTPKSAVGVTLTPRPLPAAALFAPSFIKSYTRLSSQPENCYSAMV